MNKLQLLTRAIASMMPLLFLACGDSDDPTIFCEAISVTTFNKVPTEFALQKMDDKTVLNRITVYKGTDSSYTDTYDYSAGKLVSIKRTEGGKNKIYAATYDGTVITKLTIANEEDIRFEYSNGKMTELKSYLATGGTFYQIGAQKYSYDASGNLTQSELQIDLVSLITVAFGATPAGYVPSSFGTTSYEASTYANPLKGMLFLDEAALFALEKMPTKITVKDRTGKTTSTDTYTFTKGTNDLPTKATAGSKYTEVVYECH